ncbi:MULTISPECIES: hypothetical protein [Pandoraea]|uniref:hypothetical protein n=1 Tax=Pandoraea TaxID=93217 RepID=UPI001F5C5A3C|nr:MULTISPECIES: hypothetical protein [Pandoraea]MCI3208272.1 hypothetical protein [Pandoraea sp. LA3]MDN4586301.1 hypothetical protein [Pandoraea capi]
MKVISNLPGMAPIAVPTGDDTPAAGTTSPATSGAHHHHHHHATSTNNTSRRRGRGTHDPAHTPDAHELLEELHQLAQHHPSTHRRKTQRRGAATSTDPESPQEMDSSDEDEALRWEAIEAQEQALERLIVQVSARDSGNERDQKDRERDNRREASLRAMSHAAEQLASPSQTTAKSAAEASRVTPTFARTLKLSPSELARTTHAAAVDAFARPATQEEISTLAAKALLALGNRYRASRHTSTPGDALREATSIIAHALAMPVAEGPASRRYATLRAVRHALVEAIRQVPSGSKTPGHDGQDSFLLLLPLMMLGLAAPMRASQRGIRQARFQAATRERLPAAEGLRK